MPTSNKSKILIVDDEIKNIRLFKAMLMSESYLTLEALSGEQALEIVSVVNPDLILLDVMMPGINGFDVCRKLKRTEETQTIPIIFISASNTMFDQIKAFSAGGVDYITKPYQAEEVLARINTHYKLHKLKRSWPHC